MDKNYIISFQAELDLNEIWEYIAEDDLSSANKLIQKFEDNFNKLSDMPNMGIKRQEIKEYLRSFSVGNLLFFIVSGIMVF